ncbi:MAG: tetratricopeptide (TPR) repeat protein, partial [Verrucomicrobiales bacterium]
MKRLRILLLLCLLTVFTGPMFGAEVPDETTKKYFQILQKRPESRPLFDRFYASWLNNGTVEALRTFLLENIEENPSPAAFQIQAAVLLELAEDEQALESLKLGRAEFPEDALLAWRLASLQTRLQQNAEAMATIKAAAALEPDAELAIRIAELEGQLFLRNGDSEAALEVWRKLLKANPDDDELRIDVIELLADEGVMDEAISASLALIDQIADPYDRAVRQMRHAELLRKANRGEEAKELYQQLLAASGVATWLEKQTLAQVDSLFREKDEITGLRSFLTDLRDAEPQRIAIRRALVGVLVSLREGDEAIEEYRDLLKITPGDRGVREGFIQLLGALERYEEGVEEVSRLVAQHPDDPELLVLLSKMQNWSGDNLGAGESVRKFLVAGTKEEHRYLRASRLLESFELVQQAQQLLEEAEIEFPESISAVEAVADFLYRNENEDAALARWEKLSKSDDAGVVLRSVRNAASRNHHEEAFAWLEARYPDFATDARFLETFLTEALAADEFEKALPSVRPLVNLTETPFDLDATSKLVVKLAGSSENSEGLIDELSRGTSPQEVCVHAALLHSSRKQEAAIESLETLAKASDSAAEFALVQLATLHQLERRFDDAADAMERLIRRPGGKKTNHLQRLVGLFRSAKRLDETLVWLREWKAISPGNPQIWIEEATVLFQMGEAKEAFRVMRQAIGRFEDDDRFPSKLAGWYLELGMAEDAEQLFWRLYDNAEDDGGRLSWARRLFESAQQQGRHEQLISRLEERAQRNRGAIGPVLALAEMHRLRNDEEKWRETLKRASLLDPQNVELLSSIASSYAAQGNWDQAQAALELAREHDHSGRIDRELVSILLSAGKPDQALRKVEEMIRAGKAARQDAELMAISMLEQVDFAEAAGFLDRLQSEFPQAYPLNYLAGVFHEEAGDTASAIESFQRVLAAPSHSPGSQVAMAVPNSWVNSTGIEESMAPDSTRRIANWWWNRRMAYNHRTGAPSGRLYHRSFSIQPIQPAPGVFYPNSGQGSQIFLPSATEMASHLALEHLGKLFVAGDDVERKEIREIWDANGVPEIFRLLLESAEKEQPKIVEILAEHLDIDETAAALWLGLNFGAQDPEKQLAAVQRVESDWPELALSGALAGFSNSGELRPKFREAIQQLLPRCDSETMSNSIQSRLNQVLQLDQARNPDQANHPFRVALRAAILEAFLAMAERSPEMADPYIVCAQHGRDVNGVQVPCRKTRHDEIMKKLPPEANCVRATVRG